MYFQPREHFFEVCQWQKTLLLMSSLGLGSLVPISRILLFPMAFLASSLTIKLGWMSLFFVLLSTIGFLLSMYFASTEQNYAPLLRNLLPSWVNWRLMILSFLPQVDIYLRCCKLCWASLKPQQIGGVSSANSTLGWPLITFPIRAFLRVRGHDCTTFMPFSYVPL